MKEITIEDLIKSDTAKLNGIDNRPSFKELCCMHDLIDNVLNPLCSIVGQLSINSGYRCEQLNRMVGGVPNSQHTKGQAADIRCGIPGKDNEEYLNEVQQWMKRYMNYDQIIRYDTFIHVSYRGCNNRRMFIDKRKKR